MPGDGAIPPANQVIAIIPPLTESELAARTADELFALAKEPSTGAENRKAVMAEMKRRANQLDAAKENPPQ